MERYEIRVAGHLGERRAHAIGCEEFRLLPDGDSLLVFTALDQAALYGLLTRLRDAGLELEAIERAPANLAPTPGTGPTERSEAAPRRRVNDRRGNHV